MVCDDGNIQQGTLCLVPSAPLEELILAPALTRLNGPRRSPRRNGPCTPQASLRACPQLHCQGQLKASIRERRGGTAVPGASSEPIPTQPRPAQRQSWLFSAVNRSQLDRRSTAQSCLGASQGKPPARQLRHRHAPLNSLKRRCPEDRYLLYGREPHAASQGQCRDPTNGSRQSRSEAGRARPMRFGHGRQRGERP
jgi:hypothetical protein